MYSTCKDSFIDSINSPVLRTSTQGSATFSNVAFLLNSIPESIVIISEKGIILEINSATSRLFGWTKDEIINRKNISFLLTNRDGEKLMNIINNEELSSFIDSSFHYHGLNKNGSTFPCDINLGLFPKSLLENTSSSSSSLNLYSGNAIIAVINTNKKVYRSSDSVLLDLKSRYQNEYDEIETLGKGGFGQVYKARNRLDGQLYAIKKIKLQSKPKEFSSTFDLQGIENLKSFNSQNTSSTTTSNLSFLSAEDLRIVREVKTFARISNHPNIVRYHASWIEVEEKKSKKKDKDNFDSDDSSSDDDDESEGYDETEETSNVNESSDSLSSSNDGSISNKVNFHQHGDSFNDESISVQQVSNDFVISFVDTQNADNSTSNPQLNSNSNNINNNNNNNNSKEYFINMDDLDSLHSSNSSNSSKSSNKNNSDDESTNINTSEETSYNPFSFGLNDDESKSYEHVRLNSLHNQKKKLSNKKGKIGLDPINTSVIKPHEKQSNLILYLIIQMELCSGQTLETWIRERNLLTEKKEIHVDRKVIFKIFKQIVQAIAHVHWNGCIHRDVKPANVFIQDGNHILLGDFGLAKDVEFVVNSPKTETNPFSTTLVDNEDESELSTEILKNIKDGETEVTSVQASNFHNLTSGVGTYIYASPEQLASSQGYDNKTDIYSLGILLFELLWPFKTGMERIKTLTNIRNGKFPDNFVEKWPLELPFLKSLLNPDPALRPTAQEILDSEVLNINYITPLYNNPTTLLNALDLRVTRVSLDPNENMVMNGRSSSKERKGHNKTLSTASKMIKNYGDCGACKQKDLAINSFKTQYVQTKDTIAKLEDSVARASKRVWVVSIITFIAGCIITLGITLLIISRGNNTLFDTSSLQSTGSTVDVRANLNSNMNVENLNFDHSAFVPEMSKVTNVQVSDSTVQVDTPHTNSFLQDTIENEKIKLVDNSLRRRKGKENDNKYNDSDRVKNNNFIITQTVSINYFYQSKTITVTRTKTKAIHFTNTKQLENSTPTN